MSTAGSGHLCLYVVPNARQTILDGLHGEPTQQALKIRLKAPPVDGQANEAAVKWLAQLVGLNQSGLRIERGHSSRLKQLRLGARAAEGVAAKWAKTEDRWASVGPTGKLCSKCSIAVEDALLSCVVLAQGQPFGRPANTQPASHTRRCFRRPCIASVGPQVRQGVVLATRCGDLVGADPIAQLAAASQ